MKISKSNPLFILLLLANMATAWATTSLKYNAETKTISAPEAQSYRWYLNGTELDGVTSDKIIATVNGEYTVESVDTEGKVVLRRYVVKTKIHVIGDSTASFYSADRYPRTGWGQVLQPFINTDTFLVSNSASSGRSSKSFYDEGKWTAVEKLMTAGDYLFIQFAHNDENTDVTKHTDPSTTYKEYLRIFINGARAKGGFPILLSSLPRNNWSGSTMQQSHKPYTEAMMEVATELNVPFIDMEAATMNYLNTKGENYTTNSIYNNLQPNIWPNYSADGNSDDTHFQENGAYNVVKLLSEELKKITGIPEIEKLKNNLVPAVRISAMPSPSLKGTITGYGIKAKEKTVTLVAKPIAGYKFHKWTLLNDTVTYSTESTISFTTDSTDKAFTAYFTSTVNVEEQSAVEQIKLFPNPTTDILNIDVKADNYKVEISDINGQKLMSRRDCKTVSLEHLPSGTYIVSIITDTKSTTRTIQVVHE